MAQHIKLGAIGLVVVSMTIYGGVGVDCALAEKAPWSDFWGLPSNGSHYGADLDDHVDYGGDEHADQGFWGEKHGTGIFSQLHRLGEYRGHSPLEKLKAYGWADALKDRILKGHEPWDWPGHGLLGRLKDFFHHHEDNDHYVKTPEPASFHLAVLGVLAAVFCAWRCHREPRVARGEARKDVAPR